MSKETAEKVYALLCTIPKGRVTTYGELAKAVGSRAPRAIGKILNLNPNAPHVPCHRVVMSDGSLGGYAGGTERKVALLTSEGLTIQAGRVVNFAESIFRLQPEKQTTF